MSKLYSEVLLFFVFLLHFFALHTNVKRCSQEGFRPCYSHSQVMNVYHVLSLSLQGFVGQVPLLAFFGLYMNTEMGVVINMYLKHPPPPPKIISIPNIYGFMVWLSRFKCFCWIPFLAFLALRRKRKRCCQVGSSPCYSQSEVVYAYKVLDL